MRPGAIGIALLSLAAAAGVARAAEIRALGGTYDEQVTQIREESGRVVVRTPQRAVPLDQVKSIRFQPPGPPRTDRRGVKVLLTTGDVLRGQLQGGDDENVGLASQGLGDTRVRLGLVRALIFDATPERERELEGGLEQSPTIDSVLLKDGGTARGSILRVDGTRVVLDTDVQGGSSMGKLQFDVGKVELVSIAPLEDPPAAVQGLRVVTRLVDGTTLTGRLVSLQGDELRITHPLAAQAGGQGAAQAGELSLSVPRVEELIVQNGAFVYLSDLVPEGVEQRFPPEFAYEVDTWGWKRDHNVVGGTLRLGGRPYDKGLGVHSLCKLTYRLDGAYREFKAVVGLDDSTRYMGEPGLGAVVFKVVLDGDKPAKEYPTGVVQRKGQAPTELSVDVTGARTITLWADFDPTTLHILGRADWADAHLIKR
jgi:hypothetical protein